MPRLLSTVLLLSAITASAQTQPATAPGMPAQLPDAPGRTQQHDVVTIAEESFKVSGGGSGTCGVFSAMKFIYIDPDHVDSVPKPCSELFRPHQRFLTTNVIIPMTWQQKGYLSLHEFTDPTNLGTILGISAITIGTDAHTAYGPGLKGYGKIVGVTLLQSATGEFFGVFAVPSLVHQDPRYHRMPHASFEKRILYSISRTAISRSDAGNSIPNYGTLSAYPIVAEIDNLYVPGIESDGPSTVKRVAIGLASDPINNLLTEFLPDVASRIHIRIIVVQRILNNVVAPESFQ